MNNRAWKAALIFGATLAAIALSSNGVMAQIENFVIRGPATKTIRETNEINVATAEKLVKSCAAWAEAHHGGASIVVTDQYGNLVYFMRTDGETKVNIDTAIMKAKTVVNTRLSSHAIANRMARGGTTELRQYSFGNYAVSGGLPILVGNQMIGVMAVGGGAGGGDEACAYQAITSIIGPQPPLAPNLPAGG